MIILDELAAIIEVKYDDGDEVIKLDGVGSDCDDDKFEDKFDSFVPIV